MPLVASHKSRKIYFIRDEECLAEILGHSDFDGFEWSVGDAILFEDGMYSLITKVSDRPFHLWSEPVPVAMAEVVRIVSDYDSRVEGDVASLQSLFAIFAAEVIPPIYKRRWFRFGK